MTDLIKPGISDKAVAADLPEISTIVIFIYFTFLYVYFGRTPRLVTSGSKETKQTFDNNVALPIKTQKKSNIQKTNVGTIKIH